MTRIPRLLLSVAAAAALAGGTLAVTVSPGSAVADAQTRRLVAPRGRRVGCPDLPLQRRGLRLRRRARALGVDNPAVTPSTSVADAARPAPRAVRRGVRRTQPGTTLTEPRPPHTVDR